MHKIILALALLTACGRPEEGVDSSLLVANGGANSVGGARHIVMWYFNQGQMTADAARDLVTHRTEAGAADGWLYDGVLLGNVNLNYTPGKNDVTYAKGQQFYDDAFRADGALDQLAAAVKDARVALNDPTRTLKVYLWIPYLTDQDAKLSTDKLKPLTWVRKMVADFEARQAGWPELELKGFYWGYTEFASAAADKARIKVTADYVHSFSRHNFEMLWIPSFHPDTLPRLSEIGIDRAVIQPNFAFQDVSVSRFQAVNAAVTQHGLSGVEFELGRTRNPRLTGDTELVNANAYMDAYIQYGWSAHALTVHYYGNKIEQYAHDPAHRAIYDRLYAIVARSPAAAQPAAQPALPAGATLRDAIAAGRQMKVILFENIGDLEADAHLVTVSVATGKTTSTGKSVSRGKVVTKTANGISPDEGIAIWGASFTFDEASARLFYKGRHVGNIRVN